MILKMLEEGKITADQAMKLLESIDAGDKSYINDEEKTSNSRINRKINEFSKTAEKIADKFGPEFISRVENVSSDFADAALKFADKMVSYVSGGISSFESYNTVTKKFSYPIENNKINVKIKTQNVKIAVKESKERDISIKLQLNLIDDADDLDNYIHSEYAEGLLNFATDFPYKIWGKLEILVPEGVDALIIETSNSKCQFDNIHGEKLSCITTNGKIEITECFFGKIHGETNNAKIQIVKTESSEAILDTSNAGIELNNSYFNKLKSHTSNGSIMLTNSQAQEPGEANYELITSNGKISIDLYQNDDQAYKVKARTSLGNINLSQLSSYYVERNDTNMQSEVVITSKNYEYAENRMIINAATTNSSINISKK